MYPPAQVQINAGCITTGGTDAGTRVYASNADNVNVSESFAEAQRAFGS